jgi:hypothetical protein
MNTSQEQKPPQHEREESTYALLVRSEEKGRVFNAILYSFLFLSAVFLIWQLVQFMTRV